MDEGIDSARRPNISLKPSREILEPVGFNPNISARRFKGAADTFVQLSRSWTSGPVTALCEQKDGRCESRSGVRVKLLHLGFFYGQLIAERRRFIFFVCHLEAFDWNLFRERIFGRKNFNHTSDCSLHLLSNGWD